MLIIDENSVYEIDEECIRKNDVPKECQTYEKIMKENKALNDLKEEEKKH